MRYCTAIVLALLWSGLDASAAVIVYDNQDDFFDNANIETTLDFDDLAPAVGHSNFLGVGPLKIQRVVFDTDGISSLSGDPAEWFIFRNGVNAAGELDGLSWGLDQTTIGVDRLSFENGGAVKSLGFYLATGSHPPDEDNFEVLVRLSDGSVFSDVFTLSYPVGPPYRGYVAQGSLIESVTLQNLSESFMASWSYDKVSHSAVLSPLPEPSSSYLLAGVALFSLRRRHEK